jgi:hypothetical protein
LSDYYTTIDSLIFDGKIDVLQNYMTYKAYYKLEKTIEDDPELSSRWSGPLGPDGWSGMN